MGRQSWDLSGTWLDTIVVPSKRKITEANECVDVDMLPENRPIFESTLLLSDNVCKGGGLDCNQFAVDAELGFVGSDEELSPWRGHDSKRC